MKKSRTLVRAALAMSIVCGGCDAAPDEAAGEPVTTTAGRTVTFEEFLGTVHQEADGVYVYDGDMSAYSIGELRQAWERMYPPNGALTAFPYNAYADDVWPDNKKLNITYCISNNFNNNKQAVINAMSVAGAAWAAKALVNFVYVPSQDANCTSANTNVEFDVNYATSTTTLARALPPSTPRELRTLTIYSVAFNPGTGWPLSGLLMHELGHALGFSHEFSQAGSSCTESGGGRPITPYDSGSIMMYPHCGGTNTSALSQSDMEGATQQYGSRVWTNAVSPGGCGHLPAGKGLDRGQTLWSCDSRFYLQHALDGNLRLYKVTYSPTGSSHTAIWSSGTANQAGYGTYMQTDGNLVIYTGLGRYIWHTNTYGNPGSSLAVQNDGNVVIYSPSGQPLWSTGTGGQ
ncbi:matrixin family metalloprotease [Pyxidicoccus trucidator]|uniref:matrixin family metalloprotease n=1 Tax=Pyxidicoccus trucidator TaxID=2709662 RepID=UPI0013DCA597|nr:matrixin family metalloprotease [Pyxidicoccus trucidator]